MSIRRELMMRCSPRRIVLTVVFIIGARLVWVSMFSEPETSHIPGHNIHEEGDPGFFARFFGTRSRMEEDDKNAVGLAARNGSFFLDGKPIRIISGSFHYFRTRPEQWRDRLERMKSAGLNTVTTYIPWNVHERQRGIYDFAAEGWDLARFINLTAGLDMHMIIRPGPYICAEWEFGGLPSWLLHDPGMIVRTSKYAPYLKHVERYFSHLLPLLANFTYQHGGPIIALQIENEFGSYATSPDPIYMRFLAELFRSHGINELLFTSDGSEHFAKGTLPGYLATVNFNKNAEKNLRMLQRFQPEKPLMVAEFWPGWFDHWSEQHHKMNVDVFNEEISIVLSREASVNFYMFTGSTNFGFWNGANHQDRYDPTVTSYDYDGLLSECGDIHPTKFQALRHLLTKHGIVQEIDLPPLPIDHPKRAYGTVNVAQGMSLEAMRSLVVNSMTLQEPIFMEFLSVNENSGQGYGWLLYRSAFVGGSLKLQGHLHDRAQIFVNGKLVETVYVRDENELSLDIQHVTSDGGQLEILVENMGRVNYGQHVDGQRKGFQGTVTSGRGPLTSWEHVPLEFCPRFIAQLNSSTLWTTATNSPSQLMPTVYRAWLDVDAQPPVDTFLDMSAWMKGIVIINGYNLGRYWSVGPQQTLYVPSPILRIGRNELMVFELEKPSSQLKFVDKPNLG